MSSTWHIEDHAVVGRETDVAAAGGTVSLAFIRATLRRLWFVWVGCALAGAAMAAGWLTLVPAQSVGTVTLLLAHPPGAQPEAAMATDVRLLKTRAVAQQLGDQLGLDVAPDDLLETILVQPATNSVLQVDIQGSDQDDAVTRARVLADTYLDYRSRQLTQQSEAVTDGYQERIDALQVQVDDLTQQYDVITSRGGTDTEVADVLALRGQLISEITRLQNEIETEELESNAIVSASRVLDEAALVPQSSTRRLGLGLGSGLIGGLGLGLALVVLYAITTGRVRSRADVSMAMGLPVMFSAGRVVSRRRRHRPHDEAALDLLVDGLETAIPSRGKRPRRLGLITVDCEAEGAMVLAGLARRLGSNASVLAVDLADTGRLARELAPPGSHPVAEIEDGSEPGSVTVVSGPTVDAVADVLLALVPFEIGRGLAHVRITAARCVVLAKAGESTAERLNTVAQAARTSGLDIEFVMLVGADGSDASFGGEKASERPRPTR